MINFWHRNSYIRRHLRYLGYRLGILKFKNKPLAPGERRGLSRRLPSKYPVERR
jgi:hypothetical protein